MHRRCTKFVSVRITLLHSGLYSTVDGQVFLMQCKAQPTKQEADGVTTGKSTSITASKGGWCSGVTT